MFTIAVAATTLFSVVLAQISLRREFDISFGAVARAAAPSLGIGIPTSAVAYAVAETCRSLEVAGWTTIMATVMSGI